MRAAILDDYQNVAMELADWSPVAGDVDIQVFHDHLHDEDEVAARLKDFEIVVVMRERTPITSSLLGKLPKLKLIVTSGMRNRGIDVDAAAANGVFVAGTPSAGGSTSELTWGLIHGLLRQIPLEDRSTRLGRWQRTVGVGLKGRTLGVIGLGRVGSVVARVGVAFDMKVIGWSQNLTEERCRELGATLVTKDELFSQSDIVTVHLLLGERSRGLVGAGEIGLMKPTAYLINTARGPIVDEAALIDALENRRIAGAAIDVFDVEPLPLDHPFRRLENTVITPHLGYVCDDNYSVYFKGYVEDIRAWLDGKPINQVAGNPP
jgi:phosphoglycerate dehydrogenase-like enzyme